MSGLAEGGPSRSIAQSQRGRAQVDLCGDCGLGGREWPDLPRLGPRWTGRPDVGRPPISPWPVPRDTCTRARRGRTPTPRKKRKSLEWQRRTKKTKSMRPAGRGRGGGGPREPGPGPGHGRGARPGGPYGTAPGRDGPDGGGGTGLRCPRTASRAPRQGLEPVRGPGVDHVERRGRIPRAGGGREERLRLADRRLPVRARLRGGSVDRQRLRDRLREAGRRRLRAAYVHQPG